MWIREAISDDDGRADMAYLSIGLLSLAAVASLVFIFSMSAISYHKCAPITTVSKGEQSTTSVVPCNFDPLPVGQSAGLIFGAFGALIGALAGYMAATRRAPAQRTLVAADHANVNIEPQPAAAPEKAKGSKR